MIADRRGARRIAAAVLAVGVVLLTASCAAGQHAATADEVPAIDGTHGSVGSMQLEGVAIHAPGASAFPAGASVQLAIVIVNIGNSADTLTNVSSPAFSGWGIVKTIAATSTSVPSAGTPTSIPAGGSLSLGLQNLGANSASSPQTLVLSSLAKRTSPLYPGNSVKITFNFAKAGATTLTVPVQLSSAPNGASIPAPSSSSIGA